jgi:hypothetical protein
MITVSPAADGWQVVAPSVEPALFKRGGQAEQCARRLAERLARSGVAVDVEIHLRDGRLGARLRYDAAVLEPA